MGKKATSIRPFVGAKDYERSRNFYRELGFEEVILGDNMCLFKIDQLGFYLQDAYVKDWVDNTMIFLEVADVDLYWKELSALDLPTKYQGVKLSTVKQLDWGKEFFLHDPAGILWHIGQFN
jgi:catechol 2,3-dioxygenase-like lactoylglutathione lyase family enzyme